MLAPVSRGGKGQVVTLTQPGTPGAHDPLTDIVTPGTDPVEHEGSGVEEQYDAFSVAQGVVAATDVKFLLSPLKLDGSDMPQPVADNWTLAYDGGPPMTIKRVKPIKPAGLVAYYELRLETA